jgi:hypothetical protein
MSIAMLLNRRCPLLLILLIVASLYPQTVTLVDFGASSSTNSFGLAGWNALLLSPGMTYSSAGPDGVVLSSSSLDEFNDNMGVRGSDRAFNPGERIVVTWYNNSDQYFVFSSRISFDDPDLPAGGATEGAWFTMRSLTDYRSTYQTIAPHTTARTVFNIVNAGVHKSAGVHSLVNINLHLEWFESWPKQYIICDKIEIMSDADIAAPGTPTNLIAQTLSDTKIQLQWQAPVDNVGVAEYLIYMNGEIEGYSRETGYTAVFLKPNTRYTFSVTALDQVKNESAPSFPVTCTTGAYAHSLGLVQPNSWTYRGAFRLPDAFLWGGEAMTFYPNGDGGPGGSGAADGYPGSLFVTNVNQREFGFVGQAGIPAPAISVTKNWEELPFATVLQEPVDIRPANVNAWGDYIDIWRTGLTYEADESRLYSAWSVHYTVTDEKHACLSCCTADNPATSVKAGAWYVGDPGTAPNDAMLGDYLFTTPSSWAANNTAGRSLITGRCRDGGLSGLGPTLYALAPVGATIPAVNSVCPVTTLLAYGPVSGSDYYHFPNSIDGYLLSDAWKDAAWISVGSQNSVVIMGNKARGENWYGYVGERMAHDWVIADIPYPDFNETDPDGKGWKAHNFIPMAIFFDPADLAQVARGAMPSYQPQPYAAIRFDPDIFYGTAREIRAISYDSQNHFLYALEFDYAREGALIVHVWHVHETATGVPEQSRSAPTSFRVLQNYPNPCNAGTRIVYTLPAEEQVIIDLYDITGKRIGRLLDEPRSSGRHEESLDLSPCSSGVFILRVRAGIYSDSKKMVMVK